MKPRFAERGQALVLIAFGIIVLIGMTGLAIDGGNAYSDRRHAQNAADTAALAAALAKVRQPIGFTPADGWKSAGDARAASNGYVDTDMTSGSTSPTVNVEIYSCDEPAASCGPQYTQAPADPTQFVQVIITSHVSTYFARVIGIPEVVNKVMAIAQAKPAERTPMFAGNAVVSLDPHGCKAVTYQGNASTDISGGGIFVNSDCSSAAFFNNSSAAALTAPSLCANGGVQYNPGSVDIPSIQAGHCGTISISDYNQLSPDCADAGTATVSADGTSMTSGNFNGATFPPAGVTNLGAGLYCINNGNFILNGGQSLSGGPVSFYVKTGYVKWNGGATEALYAGSANPNDPSSLGGLLIYLPPTNNSTVTINGNSTSGGLGGTILAPSSQITVEGTAGATAGGGLDGQIIGWDVSLNGTSNINISYSDQRVMWNTTDPMTKPSQ